MVRSIALGGGGVALVDDEDYERIAKYHWTLSIKKDKHYAVRFIPPWTAQRIVYMHREVLAADVGTEIDHKDGNGLHNVRSNLRTVTHQQNAANARGRGGSSRFKGVCWDAGRRKWMAGIKVNYRRIYLGRFDDEEAAAKAYDVAASHHFGEFARLNLP